MPRATLHLALTLLAVAAAVDGAGAQRNQRRDGDALRHRRAGWSCPDVAGAGRWPDLSCHCDLAHTLRCSSASASLDPLTAEKQVAGIVAALRIQPRERFVSLLDLSIQNVSRLAAFAFDRVPLHGLVVASGEIRDVSADAFAGLGATLSALGLPGNRLTAVPARAIAALAHLERLDLSNNRIRSIAGDPFAGLERLRFLDLSGNGLETLGDAAFRSPSPLRSLHLGANRLDASQLDAGAVAGLKRLQEMDLSANRLRGRLTSSFLQGLESLVTLDLTANNFTLLKRGMLSGLKRLRTLRLARNQIDVIEDQSFVALTSLTTLDLSHNGVVAISGQSLSHLDDLSQLDLSHNYLRAVTSDLVNGLPNLESLDLTDNDIATVEPGVLSRLPKLVHLLLTDNPLNCDCHSLELAAWLRNGTDNALADESNRKAALCATPPSLENALLHETDAASLTCESAPAAHGAGDDARDDSHLLSSQPTEDFIRLSSAQVQFVSAELEGAALLHTAWTVDAATLPYTCDAVLVYELSEVHEALLDSYPVRCHSEERRPDEELRLTIKLGDNMKPDGQYRLCLVLFEGGHDDEASLLPGCSHSITWQTLKGAHDYSDEADQLADTVEASPALAQITAFYANVSSTRSVSVFMRILDATRDCQFTVVVFQSHRLLARKQLNCTATSFAFGQLAEVREPAEDPVVPLVEYATGEYQVCATFDRQGEFLPPPDGERQADGDIVLTASRQSAEASSVNSSIVRYEHCVVAKMPARAWAVENTLVVIAVTVIFLLIAAALLLLTYLLARRVFFRRSKLLWCHSSDPLSSSVPKATSSHILYVPESDYFTDSSSYSSADGREETSTNV